MVNLSFVPGEPSRYAASQTQPENYDGVMMPAVPTGSHRLAEQIGDWAIYAGIKLSVHARDSCSPSPIVTLDDGVNIDSFGQTEAAIAFGVTHALGFIPESDCIGVVVHELHTQSVDTTPAAIAFVACHALLKCWGLAPPFAPYFDRDNKAIIFPCGGGFA